MRKVGVLVILFFIISPSLYAQIEGISEDSISYYLCKKWQEKGRYLGGHQIQAFGDGLRYEFNKDSSFAKIVDNKTEKGTWVFEKDKKVVRLQLKNGTDFYIVFIKPKEMLLSTDINNNPPNPTGIMMILKTVD